MQKIFLRTYHEYDLEDVKEHLLIMGDLSADCSKCRAIGIEAAGIKNCPQCGTEFRYVTSRRIEAHAGERFQIVKRMRDKYPGLVFIDFGDYQRTLGAQKARDFFG
ncbi:MAG: hypothetical protein PHN49_10795 [Candidatus Omnitrophica bacterium]|nr:hypothetical protein [Candidatus Omnitrophota bacterium]MDD5672116.1 hypothetical protein [Candidatus Omnitrophota bacterium]